MKHTATQRSDALWTVGQLSRRTGISIKAIRDYTDHGLVNTRGRSAAGYRTYTSEALWCLQFITTLRDLGLTLAEIRGLTHPHPQPPGLRLAGLLAASRERVNERVAALQATLARIDAYERDHHGELTGQQPLWGRDRRAHRNGA
jgi:DNA-binding transcriptional MerR regulator